MTGYFHDPEIKRKQCKFFNKTVQTRLKLYALLKVGCFVGTNKNTMPRKLARTQNDNPSLKLKNILVSLGNTLRLKHTKFKLIGFVMK